MRVIKSVVLVLSSIIVFVEAYPAIILTDTIDGILQKSSEAEGVNYWAIDWTNKNPTIGPLSLSNKTKIPYDDQHVEALGKRDEDRNIYIFNTESDLQKHPEAFENKRNGIILKEDQKTMYYSEKEDSWIIQEYKKTPKKDLIIPYTDKIPVTSCLDSTQGSGGGIARSYSFSITANGKLYFEFSQGIGSYTFGLNAGVSTSTSQTFSYSYSCNVEEGYVGQLYVQPFMVQIPQSTTTRIYYDNVMHKYERGAMLDELQRMRVIADRQPAHHCVVVKDASLLQCNVPIGGTLLYNEFDDEEEEEDSN
ncbi:uncharacterized protein RJT21DRAFT_128789 [Scheffersomyces amazonensis]|uniref:uncharacterized protein n=1 Tax=Scheffersomyces amazonensis TaxID=1078765 RepID=UPI00315DA014